MPNFLKKSMKLNWNSLEGEEVQNQKPSVVGIWMFYFSVTMQFPEGWEGGVQTKKSSVGEQEYFLGELILL